MPMVLDEFSSKVLNTALGLVEEAQKRGVVIRILGALAVYLHCQEMPETLEAIKRMGRLEGDSIFTDIDVIAYSKQRKHLINLMKDLQYDENRMINLLFGHKRLLYVKEGVKVDVFFDKLEFSHDVPFGNAPGKGRLELDYPTISLADLVLEKLQIHQINRKDIVDLIALFMTHEVGEKLEREVIDGGYIASLLSDDWGFWYDATENLKKVLSFVDRFSQEGVLSLGQAERVRENVGRLRSMIDAAPKTKNWKKRAKAGTSKPWYREVGELEV